MTIALLIILNLYSFIMSDVFQKNKRGKMEEPWCKKSNFSNKANLM